MRYIAAGVAPYGAFVWSCLLPDGGVMVRVDHPLPGRAWQDGEWVVAAEKVEAPPDVWLARQEKRGRIPAVLQDGSAADALRPLLLARMRSWEFCAAARKRHQERFGKKAAAEAVAALKREFEEISV